ncbi:MAG TPA: DUF4175 family protein [Ignavibacteria bacterium]
MNINNEILNKIINQFAIVNKEENLLVLKKNFLLFVSLTIFFVFILTTFEGFFYFSKLVRAFFFFFIIIVFLCSLFFLFIKPLFYYLGIFNNFNIEKLAKRLGEKNPQIKDRLLNVIQIINNKENKYGYSILLSYESLNRIYNDLKNVNFSIIIDKEQIKKPIIITLITIFLVTPIFYFNSDHFIKATHRIIHFNQFFQPPAPFEIYVEPGNVEITRGDSIKVNIAVNGKVPEIVNLNFKNIEQKDFETLNLKIFDNKTSYVFKSIKEDFEYYVNYEEISTEKYIVKVVDRPVIRNLRVSILPPSYTKENVKYLDDNIGDIIAIKGSRVRIEVEVNKVINDAKIIFGDSTSIKMKIENKKCVSEFTINKDNSYFIYLEDEKGAKNIDPVIYTIKMINDDYPSITIIQPNKNSDINEDMRLGILLKIKDDYGFSKLQLGYRLVKTKYSAPQKNYSFINIPLSNQYIKEQDISYLWNLSPLGLAPDDVVEFIAEVYDNDVISGPKSTKTGEYFVRFPSLDEILKKADENQKRAFKELDKTYDEAKELKKKLDEINQDLKKNKDIDWQKQKKIEELTKKYSDLQNKVEQLSKNIDEMSKTMAENKLISNETMEKYMELQKLMSEINSPEFSQALKKLQESMQNINPDMIKQALQNFTFNEQSFRMSIERTMNIMKRVMIEQKTDDVLKRIEKLIENQNEIKNQTSKVNPNDKNKLQDLANKQDELRRDLNEAKKELNDLQNRMQEFRNEMPLNELEKISENFQNKNTDQKMQNSAQQMQMGEIKNSQQSQDQVMKDLSDLQKEMQNFKKNLLEGQFKQVMNALRNSLKDLLEVSQKEEDLKNQTKNYNQFSQKSRELAQKQANLQNELMNVINQLYNLSQKSFAITPQIGKSIGNALAKMNQATNNLSERDIYNAANNQTEAMSSLNQTAKQLQNAIKQMANQGGQGGMLSLLQQLGSLAARQQGINQGMIPFGGGKGGDQLTPQQQAELARLLGEQQAVQKSLEQLKEEAEKYGNKEKILGDLDKISKEMQEVIRDMKDKNVDENTLQKQERILSRLLDAQRSMRERDFEKQRKSNVGKDFTRQSPKEIDFNSLEGKNKLQQDLLKAIEAGYAKDYENIIRKYFESLNKTFEKK